MKFEQKSAFIAAFTRIELLVINLHVSYFVGADAQDTSPTMLLIGDRNLEHKGHALKPGLFVLSTNNGKLGWTKEIHDQCGNIGLSDGSVKFLTSRALTKAALDQGCETNRLCIP